jgi:exodeoxyribonuclease V alpha subunit
VELSILDTTFADQICPRADPLLRGELCRLMAASRQGHLCIRLEEKISIPPHLVEKERIDVPQKPLVQDQNRLYLQRNWVIESTLIRHLIRILEAPQAPCSNIGLAPELSIAQAEAVRHALTHSLTFVCGGPGTGKTFTAAQIIRALASQRTSLKVKVAAPTGKAADRLLQGIDAQPGLNVDAMTLHRLLKLQPGRSMLFSGQLLEADLVLVDEASMIDASLFAHLLSVIPTQTRLVLLGDPDQLPPVDGACVFRDLSSLFGVRLQQCHRTKEADLHRLFDAINRGDAAPLLDRLEPIPDDLYAWIEARLDAQFICPLRQGPYGVDAINSALLKRLESRLAYGQEWSAPLLVTGNDRELDLFNGTSGRIVGRYQGRPLPDGSEKVHFDEGRSFFLKQLPSYEIAYALSAHKSQGSEFERVICLIPEGSEEFGREALYTALTRAKKEICLIGIGHVLESMLSKTSVQNTGIKERLANVS